MDKRITAPPDDGRQKGVSVQEVSSYKKNRALSSACILLNIFVFLFFLTGLWAVISAFKTGQTAGVKFYLILMETGLLVGSGSLALLIVRFRKLNRYLPVRGDLETETVPANTAKVKKAERDEPMNGVRGVRIAICLLAVIFLSFLLLILDFRFRFLFPEGDTTLMNEITERYPKILTAYLAGMLRPDIEHLGYGGVFLEYWLGYTLSLAGIVLIIVFGIRKIVSTVRYRKSRAITVL